MRIIVTGSDNELIRQVKAKMLTSLFGTNSSKNQELQWDHSKHSEEINVAVFQLASLRCNSFQSKPCELTLMALIGLHPLSSATVWGQWVGTFRLHPSCRVTQSPSPKINDQTFDFFLMIKSSIVYSLVLWCSGNPNEPPPSDEHYLSVDRHL